MYRKNTASQYIGFTAISASTGATMTGTTGFAAYRVLDGGAQASATGTVTDKGNGQYSFALSQADTNGNNCSIMFTMTGMVAVEKTFITTACDPTTATNFGITALPATACTTNASLITSGTGTAQLSVSSGLVTLAGVTHTGAVVPTVTNLTNAPTAGDFTATMKTSIGTAVAASAVASVTGNVGGNVAGSVGSVVGAVGSVTANVGINLAQTLSAARDVSAVADTSLTLNDGLHAAIVCSAGRETISGTTYTVKTPTGTTFRIFTLDSGTAPTSRT